MKLRGKLMGDTSEDYAATMLELGEMYGQFGKEKVRA